MLDRRITSPKYREIDRCWETGADLDPKERLLWADTYRVMAEPDMEEHAIAQNVARIMTAPDPVTLLERAQTAAYEAMVSPERICSPGNDRIFSAMAQYKRAFGEAGGLFMVALKMTDQQWLTFQMLERTPGGKRRMSQKQARELGLDGYTDLRELDEMTLREQMPFIQNLPARIKAMLLEFLINPIPVQEVRERLSIELKQLFYEGGIGRRSVHLYERYLNLLPAYPHELSAPQDV